MNEEKRMTLDDFDFSKVKVNPPKPTQDQAHVLLRTVEGAGVALVTPFTESGEVNYEKLEALLEEQIAGGTDAIIACGTTGESATMSYE